MSFIQRRLISVNQSKISEIFRYVLAGGTALFVHLFVLAVLVEVFQTNETFASALGFICATPVNYLLQKIYVFKSSAKLLSSFSVYCAITLITLALNTILFWAILLFSSLHYSLVQIITTIIVFILNYYLNRNVTFKQR